MDELRSQIEAEIPHLRRYARALIGHADEADDLVQASLERALVSAAQWDKARRLRPWLFRIQHNLYVSWVRRRSRELAHRERYPAPKSIDGNQDISAELDNVRRALADLPAEQRSAILLIALEGLSYEEASEVLSIPVGTLRSRLSRGREALRQALNGSATRAAAGGGSA